MPPKKKKKKIQHINTENAQERSYDDSLIVHLGILPKESNVPVDIEDSESTQTDYSIESFEDLKDGESPTMIKVVDLYINVKTIIIGRFMNIYSFYSAYNPGIVHQLINMEFTIFTLSLLGYIGSYGFYFLRRCITVGLINDNARILAFILGACYLIASYPSYILIYEGSWYLNLLKRCQTYIYNYSEIIEMIVFCLLVGYGLRNFVESVTFVRLMWLKDASSCILPFYGTLLLALFAILFSNAIRCVKYSKMFINFILAVLLLDRVATNPVVHEWFILFNDQVVDFWFKGVYPFAYFMVGSQTVNCTFQLIIQCIICSSIAAVTDLLWLPDVLGTESIKKIKVPASLWISSIQIMAILLSPIMAIFVALPSIHLLSTNEMHAIITAILSGVILTFNAEVLDFTSKFVIAEVLISSVPCVNIVCAMTAPISKKNETSLSIRKATDKSQIVEIEGGMPGFRAALYFGGKIISCVIITYMALPVVLRVMGYIISFGAKAFFQTHGYLASLDSLIGLFMTPILKLIGIRDSDLSDVSLTFGRHFGGHLASFSHTFKLIKTMLAYECVENELHKIAVLSPSASTTTYIIKWGWQEVSVLPLGNSLNGYSMKAIMNVKLRMNSFINTALVYNLFTMLNPRAAKKVSQVILRAFFSSVFVTLMSITIIYIYSIPGDTYKCKIPGKTPVEVCRILLINYNEKVNMCKNYSGVLLLTESGT